MAYTQIHPRTTRSAFVQVLRKPRYVGAHAVGGAGGGFRRVERAHYALPNGSWVRGPVNAGFVQVSHPRTVGRPGYVVPHPPVMPPPVLAGVPDTSSIDEFIAALLANRPQPRPGFAF
jgi:hypothetical protein